MSNKFKCPFCFEEIEDDKVHFRSERVVTGENPALPSGYVDIEQFEENYTGADKESILQKYKKFEFFRQKSDPKYEAEWAGLEKTEFGRDSKIKPFERMIINPNDTAHQEYLQKQQDGSYFIRDTGGMVVQIELSADMENGWLAQRCHRRVCPWCHNPLPNGYGKYPDIKFISVIGIQGAGKTIYLSKLLEGMQELYAPKLGLSATACTTEILKFIEQNKVEKGNPVPSPTPAKARQQPLYYQINRPDPNHVGGVIPESMIIYDVAGEIFDETNHEANAYVNRYAKYIANSDAYILLIKPDQINYQGVRARHPITEAINAIYSILINTVNKAQINRPFAVCLSQADSPIMSQLFDNNFITAICTDVHVAGNGRLKKFNATAYNPIGRSLMEFFQMQAGGMIDTTLTNNFPEHAYFAFTALGCGTEERYSEERGTKEKYPVADVIPRRIEEALYWIFYKIGYIKSDIPVYGEIRCKNPACGSKDCEYTPGDFIEETIQEKVVHFFKKERKIKRQVNCKCKECQTKWFDPRFN